MNELNILLEQALTRLSEQYKQDIEALSRQLNEVSERAETTNQLCSSLTVRLEDSANKVAHLQGQLRRQTEVWSSLAGQVKDLETLLQAQNSDNTRLANSLQSLIQRLNELN